MSEEFEEVKPVELNTGDVVHVSFKSGADQTLYLNEKVIAVRDTYVSTEGGCYFWKEYSRYYLVEKAEHKLPTKIGSAVKHPDGWQFIRIGEDNWKGIDPEGEVSATRWWDAEISCDDWKEL